MIKRAEDVYAWHALYGDERSTIYEMDGHDFSSIDRSQIKALLLVPLAGGVAYRVDIPQDAQPVFFRRRSVEVNPLQGESTPRPTVHCIGWKRGDEAVYLFVFDDGSTLLSSDLQAV